MTMLLGKTPVSILQEYLVSQHMTPRYSLVYSKIGTHNPWFVIRVTVGSSSEEGEGRSKQEAKHNAAQKMLITLKLVDTNQTTKMSDSENGLNGINLGENYVGMLKEYCLSQTYPEPEYELYEEAGPAHSKVFKMSCRVSQLQDFGIDRTKKQAKQIAAFKLLERLKQGKDDKPEQVDATIVETPKVKKIPEISLTVEEIQEKYMNHKYGGGSSYKEPAVYYKDYHRAYVGIQELSPTLTEVLGKSLTEFNRNNSLNVVKNVAKELEVGLTCKNLKTKNPSSGSLVMTLNLTPPIASVGSNLDHAAFNILKSLLLLCS